MSQIHCKTVIAPKCAILKRLGKDFFCFVFGTTDFINKQIEYLENSVNLYVKLK